MKYLVDTQLPPRLAKHLSDKGVDAIHITSFENGHLFSDEKIREIAIEQQRAIITKDADFFDYFMVKGAPPSVLLIKFGNCSNQILLKLINERWELIEQEFREKRASLVVVDHNGLISF